MKLNNLIVGLVASFSLFDTALAQTKDKSQYTLFNPTPKADMRELSTDRPDKTESPYTVDAGHFQIEADLMNVSMNKDKASDTETTSSSYVAMNLKAGLTNNMDLQVVVSPYTKDRVKTSGIVTEDSGGGDTDVRLKINLLGNDGGDVAIALMPYVKMPTAPRPRGNGKYEGGLILPIGFSLPNDWGMGVMFQVDHVLNSANEKYHAEFISSITASHHIAGDLGGYVEFFSQSSEEAGSEWIATVDAGLTYGLNEDTQIDLGANFGASPAADDVNPFLGLSVRF